jgi:hypothetical protein
LTARARFVEALSQFRTSGDRKEIPRCLEGLAGVAAATGDEGRAAHLFGAAEAMRETIRTLLPTSLQADYNRRLAPPRPRLRQVDVQQRWQGGRSAPLDESIAMALNEN